MYKILSTYLENAILCSLCKHLYKYLYNTSTTLVKFWANQGVEGERVFLKEFREMVLSLYRRHWNNSLRTEGRLTVSLSLART